MVYVLIVCMDCVRLVYRFLLFLYGVCMVGVWLVYDCVLVSCVSYVVVYAC